MLLAAPVLISTLFMLALDRTAQTGFFNSQAGGSPYLYENLFWIFGHPEVYVLALPGMGIVLEILPVFARKPLWGYRLAVTGMLGITLLSFLVWQHHLFVSGINADLRPFYMLSTELISLPTGFIFVCALGTLWRGRIRLTVPMLFALAWLFNFLIGGLSGVFLSDVPSDVTTHGSFFSMAHFHYTIMGGLIFAFFGAHLLLGAEDDRLQAERAAREGALLGDVHRVQLDVRAAARDRVPGHAAARRHVRRLSPGRERLGLGLGVRARRVDAHLPRQLHLVAGVRARCPPARTRGARSRSSSSCRRRCPCTTSTASRRSDPIRIRTAIDDAGSRGRRPVISPGEAAAVTELAQHRDRLRRPRARAAGDRSSAT